MMPMLYLRSELGGESTFFNSRKWLAMLDAVVSVPNLEVGRHRSRIMEITKGALNLSRDIQPKQDRICMHYLEKVRIFTRIQHR